MVRENQEVESWPRLRDVGGRSEEVRSPQVPGLSGQVEGGLTVIRLLRLLGTEE